MPPKTRRPKAGEPGYSPAGSLRRAQRDKEKAKKPRGTRGSRNAVGATCNAKKKGGGRCTLSAGWGTLHPGTGSCKLHGGSVPNHNKAAIQGEAVLMGAPKEINPLDALLWCIKITAGEIDWLSLQMEQLEKSAWVEETIVGKQFHLYARERRGRMQDLARYSQMAVSLGIAERAVHLAEQYGEMLARLLRGIEGGMKDKLNLTPEQQIIWDREWPLTLRQQLIVIEGGASQLVDGRKALPAASEEAA